MRIHQTWRKQLKELISSVVAMLIGLPVIIAYCTWRELGDLITIWDAFILFFIIPFFMIISFAITLEWADHVISD